jgi:hypothetical protein
MNAVEIEETVSALAEEPFSAAEFPFALLVIALAIGIVSPAIVPLRVGRCGIGSRGRSRSYRAILISPPRIGSALTWHRLRACRYWRSGKPMDTLSDSAHDSD